MDGGIDGGADDDTINIGTGAGVTTVLGGVAGGTGDDTITVTGTVTTDVAGNDGDDLVRLAAAATLTGSVDGGLEPILWMAEIPAAPT